MIYERNTLETKIKIEDGAQSADTGIGFFDHMLSAFLKHGCFDYSILVKGDLEVDQHHTIEDTGIALGQVLSKADKTGIKRFSFFAVPMDESLVTAALDFSGRPYFVWDFPYTGELSIYQEFFRALAFNAGATLHMKCTYGNNAHHMIEAAFKAAARAFREALLKDGTITGIPSTKGTL